MRIAITGHRPEKVTNWQYAETQLKHALHDFGAGIVIQGMAAGIDLVAAKIAYQSNIPYWCAVPYKNHRGRTSGSPGYTDSWKIYYDNALKYANKVIYVTEYEDYPGSWVFQTRNEWMVDNADMLVAYWDGSPGGTHNCIKYAREKEMQIWHIDPSTLQCGWLL
jgi:uncharacterized phage-like protein YoqJ